MPKCPLKNLNILDSQKYCIYISIQTLKLVVEAPQAAASDSSWVHALLSWIFGVGVGNSLRFCSANPLMLCQAGWGLPVNSHFQLSSDSCTGLHWAVPPP